MWKKRDQLKKVPHFDDDEVNFSSPPEYSPSGGNNQSKTKMTPEQLKLSLDIAKKQAGMREATASQSPVSTIKFEDLTVPADLPSLSQVKSPSTRIESRDGGELANSNLAPVSLRDLIRPRPPEDSRKSTTCQVETTRPGLTTTCQVETTRPGLTTTCQVETTRPGLTTTCQVETTRPGLTTTGQVETTRPGLTTTSLTCQVETTRPGLTNQLSVDCGRQYSRSTMPDFANSPSPCHVETVHQVRNSDVANPSAPLQAETERRTRQISSSTELNVDSENIDQLAMCGECKQERGSLSCVHCNFSFCKRCYQAVHMESCPVVQNKECCRHPGKILEYWCAQDQQPVCSDCALFGNHKGHEISKLEQRIRNEEAVREILLILPKVIQVRDALVESKKAVKACPQEEMKKIHDKVSAFFKDKRDALEKKEDDMHLQIEESQQQLTLDCNTNASEIDEHIADLENLLKDGNKCLEFKKSGLFIDNNGNNIDIRMLLDQLKNASLLPCQFKFQEPICKIDQDGLEVNYVEPKLQSIENHIYQATPTEKSEEKSPMKVEENINNQLELQENNDGVIKDANRYKENINTKVSSEEKLQSDDNVSSKSDENKVPDKDSKSSDMTSRCKGRTMSPTREAVFKELNEGNRSVVLENVPAHVEKLHVRNWAGFWGKVEGIQFQPSLRGSYVITFKAAKAAEACLNDGKKYWKIKEAEINVRLTVKRYTNSIYCRNLPKEVNTLELEKHMSAFGSVVDVKIEGYKSNRAPFAIVDFSSQKERDAALAKEHHVLNGCRFIVQTYGDRSHGGRKQVGDNKPQTISKETPKTSRNLKLLNKSQEKEGLDNSLKEATVDTSQEKEALDNSPKEETLDVRQEKPNIVKCQEKEALDNSLEEVTVDTSLEKAAFNECQEKEGPLSTSTPLETSIICEVGKASFRNPYKPDVHRTQSGELVPTNTDSENNSSNSEDLQNLNVLVETPNTHPEIHQFFPSPDENCNFEEGMSRGNNGKEKDLKGFYQSSTQSEAPQTIGSPHSPAYSEAQLKGFYQSSTQSEAPQSIASPHSPAYSEAQLTNDGWIRPILPRSSSLEVKVTHMDANGTVWVVPLVELRAHKFISKILTNFCEDLISSPDTMSWRPGQRAVVFHEGRHERVEILTVTTDRAGSKATVIMVDNGKTIHCKGEELLIAPRSGLPFTYPSLAMPVRLYGILINALLDQTHVEEVLGRVKQKKCTLALAWTPSSFPLPGSVRYTTADCPEGLAQSGNMAEDLMDLGCGKLVLSFNDWMDDMGMCDLGWMLDESYFGIDPTKAIPVTLPLRAGHWIPCKAITLDDEVRMVGLQPMVEDMGILTSSLSLSILQAAVTSAHKRMDGYSPMAEAEKPHLFPTVGENVLVFSDEEWCRARVVEITDQGAWVVFVDYIYQELVKPKYIRRVPVVGGLDEYWHLHPIHSIRASWPLTGTETQAEIDRQKELLLSSVEYFKVTGFKEISFDDEKHEVVGHFYDGNKNRLI